MMINTNISDHTLALFGKSTDQSGDKPTIKTDGLDQAANAAKYAPTTSASPAAPTGEGPKDTASSYRPKLDVEMPGHYIDPRAASGTERAAPAYDGPSYTERADGGSLLETVMADLDTIKNNQLAAMKDEFQARVEVTIGRELTEDEDVYDFHTQAIISNDDWMLGQNANSLEARLWAAEGGSTSITRAVSPMNQDLSEDELTQLVIQSRVESQILSIQTSIAMANDYSSKQAGSEDTLSPTLSDDEIQILREELLTETRSQVEQGELQISFDYSRFK